MKKTTPYVKAKKYLGQHFLKDETIAYTIVESLITACNVKYVLEVGPGMGVLTKHLLNTQVTTYVIDIDSESIVYLHRNFPELASRIVEGDFLSFDFYSIIQDEYAVIGNFPYNISSQIVFHILEHRHHIPCMVGMFQKEVAERICAKPGTKTYGILSVLVQAYYTADYLFTVDEHVFVPPPKVKSAVIRMLRKPEEPPVKKQLLFKVVKTAFNQRRKKLRNALHVFGLNDAILQQAGFADKRAEELSLEQFYTLTKLVEQHGLPVN
ncbi:MAG: 16S rRNA (adenine(1518)-N(6)/adenine(1519)-N(6))-dimethyltransferase RsmA [Bacteroidota bacterium]|jgi:16S rRNA (adenine1518-N6/adenine1519-N6)-dimethyltransferase